MLFDLTTVPDFVKPQEDHAASMVATGGTSVQLCHRHDKLTELLPRIEPDHYYHLHSSGNWAMHELLLHLLAFTGPARVTLATWSMSELAVRQLTGAMDAGLITQLQALMDVRVKIRTPEAYEFLNYRIADIRLTACHAKTTVIENDTWGISIISSANFTNNPRIETSVVSTVCSAAEFHRVCIETELRKAHKFEHV